jgi:hypothetical protein
MTTKTKATEADEFLARLKAAARTMPRGPHHEQQVLRLLAQLTDEPGDALRMLMRLRDG